MEKYKVLQPFFDSKNGNVKHESGDEVTFTKERAAEILAHQKEPLIEIVSKPPEVKSKK